MTAAEKFNEGENTESLTDGESKFFHIEILPTQNYKRFRMQSVGEKVGIESVGGQRTNGEWETIKWIISKDIAHVEDGKLIARNRDAQELFDRIGFVPQHIEGSRYGAKSGL